MSQNVRQTIIEQPASEDPADKRERDYRLTQNELKDLEPLQDLFIDYCAFASLSVDPDGSINRMTMQEIGTKLGVTDRTLRRWRRTIPNFAALVKQRRKDKFATVIEDGVWRGVIAKALLGEAKQAEMVLSYFSDYVPPAQRHEVKVNGLADLAQQVRTKHAPQPIEAQVIDQLPEETNLGHLEAVEMAIEPQTTSNATLQPAQAPDPSTLEIQAIEPRPQPPEIEFE